MYDQGEKRYRATMKSHENQRTWCVQGIVNSLIGLSHHIQSRRMVREETGGIKIGQQVLRKFCEWHADGYTLYTIGANKKF